MRLRKHMVSLEALRSSTNSNTHASTIWDEIRLWVSAYCALAMVQAITTIEREIVDT